MGWQVRAAPAWMGFGCECWVGSGAADWPPANRKPRHFPFREFVTRQLASGGVILEGLRGLVSIFYFKHGLLHTHMILFLFFFTSYSSFRSLISVQTMWENAHVSEIIICIKSFIFEGPYVRNVSLFWLFTTVRNEQLTSRIPPQERSKLSVKHILIRSKLHWLVHPIFYLRWVSFWFSLAILCLFSYFYLVDLSSTSSRDQNILHTIPLPIQTHTHTSWVQVYTDGGRGMQKPRGQHDPQLG